MKSSSVIADVIDLDEYDKKYAEIKEEDLTASFNFASVKRDSFKENNETMNQFSLVFEESLLVTVEHISSIITNLLAKIESMLAEEDSIRDVIYYNFFHRVLELHAVAIEINFFAIFVMHNFQLVIKIIRYFEKSFGPPIKKVMETYMRRQLLSKGSLISRFFSMTKLIKLLTLSEILKEKYLVLANKSDDSLLSDNFIDCKEILNKICLLNKLTEEKVIHTNDLIVFYGINRNAYSASNTKSIPILFNYSSLCVASSPSDGKFATHAPIMELIQGKQNKKNLTLLVMHAFIRNFVMGVSYAFFPCSLPKENIKFTGSIISFIFLGTLVSNTINALSTQSKYGYNYIKSYSLITAAVLLLLTHNYIEMTFLFILSSFLLGLSGGPNIDLRYIRYHCKQKLIKRHLSAYHSFSIFGMSAGLAFYITFQVIKSSELASAFGILKQLECPAVSTALITIGCFIYHVANFVEPSENMLIDEEELPSGSILSQTEMFPNVEQTISKKQKDLLIKSNSCVFRNFVALIVVIQTVAFTNEAFISSIFMILIHCYQRDIDFSTMFVFFAFLASQTLKSAPHLDNSKACLQKKIAFKHNGLAWFNGSYYHHLAYFSILRRSMRFVRSYYTYQFLC